MVKSIGPQTLRRAKYNAKRAQRKKLAQLGPEETSRSVSIAIITTGNCLVKVQPRYRQRYNAKRKENRADARKIDDTEAQTAAKIILNKKVVDKYNALTLDQRRRDRGADRVIKRQIRRKFLTLERCISTYKLIFDEMVTDENKAYIKNKKLRKLLCTSEKDMIAYLVGSQCNMDRTLVEQMDPVIRQATFIQLDRVNEVFTATQRAAKKRGELDAADRSANIINHFHTVTSSFDDGAIKKALNSFWIKSIRDESGACSKLALTVALNQQSYMSCNMTGLQTIADCVNRDLPSGKGIFPARSTVQLCGHEIATGTKAVVSATIDDDDRVYRVDFVTELLNIVRLSYVQLELQLPTERIRMYIDDSYVGDPAWKGCVIRIATTDSFLMAEIKRHAIDINLSCDGFELASASNGGVGLIMTFKGREMLSKINKDYHKQKDNPEFGDRAGCHSINSVLFQGLAIGPDNYDISKRLAEPTLKLAQELARPGMIFYDGVNEVFYAFKMTITVDKKEGNQLTVTGGGTYLTKFFDIYTDDNQETKGLPTWRSCDHCFIKGRRIYGAQWTRFSHHNHDFNDYTRVCKEFNSAARARREQNALEKKAATIGTRISLVKREDRIFKALEKTEIFNSPLYDAFDNTLAPCHHRDVLGEVERKLFRDLPSIDWRRSTVFCGLSLNARRDRIVMTAVLLKSFGVSAEDIASSTSQSALDLLWRDQIAKKYVPIADVMQLNETSVPEKGQLSDYDKLVVNERIHGIYAVDPMTSQRLIDLANEMDLISLCTFRALPNEFERRKLILLFAKFIGNRIEYCNIERDRIPIVTRIEMLVPCGLHNNIRIPSSLLTNLRVEINGRKDYGPVQKKLLGEKLEEVINKSVGSGTNANFRYTITGSRVQVVSLSGVKLIQIMDNWAALVDVVFGGLDNPEDVERKFKWCDLGERFVDCMLLLNYKFDMTTADEINRFQLCFDLFCRSYRELIGIDKETNYIQNMSAGVFRFFISTYGSIYAYNNTAMEACAGREQDFFQKGTQHDVDGHRGKSLIEAFMDHHFIGRAILMDTLAPGALVEAVDSGKARLNIIRNEKLQAKRLREKGMQINNINMVEREIIVGERDEKGHLKFIKRLLLVGDPMPTKSRKRVFSNNELLQKSLLKNFESNL